MRLAAHFDPGTEASNIIKTVPFWEVSLLTKYLLLRRFTPVEGWYSRVSAGCAGTNCTHYLKNYSDFGEYVTCTRLCKIYGMFLPNEPSRMVEVEVEEVEAEAEEVIEEVMEEAEQQGQE